MNSSSWITVNRDQCGDQPCIRVRDVLDLLAAGANYREILADYPLLEPEDIIAAIDYAATRW